METLQSAWEAVRGFFETVFTTNVMNGQSLSDYVTFEAILGVVGDVLLAILILVVGSIIAGAVRRRIRSLAVGREDRDTTLFKFLGNMAKYVVMAFAFLFVLNTFGVQTTSIVAAVGAAGLAIGLALQGTLTNIAAGVMIILFRPFKDGDFVTIAGETGEVQEISINFTELATIGNVQVIVPNSDVWGNKITNYSSYPNRQAEWTFAVAYDTDLGQAEKVIHETITSDERTQTGQDPLIKVNNLGDSAVDILVRAWVSADDYFNYQAEMKRAVKEALDRAGIDIPYPHRRLVMDEGALSLNQDREEQRTRNGGVEARE